MYITLHNSGALLEVQACRKLSKGTHFSGPLHCTGQWSYLLVQQFDACFVRNLHSRGERGSNGRECKFQNKAHRIFDPRNTLSPVKRLIINLSAAAEGGAPPRIAQSGRAESLRLQLTAACQALSTGWAITS